LSLKYVLKNMHCYCQYFKLFGDLRSVLGDGAESPVRVDNPERLVGSVHHLRRRNLQ
jgi:hypothetical protein